MPEPRPAVATIAVQTLPAENDPNAKRVENLLAKNDNLQRRQKNIYTKQSGMTEELIFLRKAQKDGDEKISKLCSAFSALEVHCAALVAEMETYWLDVPGNESAVLKDEKLMKFIKARVRSDEATAAEPANNSDM